MRARIDGEVKRLEEDIKLHRYKYHTIELVLDRLKAEPDKRSRIAEAVEQALALADGLAAVVRGDAEGERAEDYRIFSTQRACPNGHGSIPEMEPRLFSFNSPLGARGEAVRPTSTCGVCGRWACGWRWEGRWVSDARKVLRWERA